LGYLLPVGTTFEPKLSTENLLASQVEIKHLLGQRVKLFRKILGDFSTTLGHFLQTIWSHWEACRRNHNNNRRWDAKKLFRFEAEQRYS